MIQHAWTLCLLSLSAVFAANDYKNFHFYLIPRSTNNCGPRGPKTVMSIDPGDFVVTNAKGDRSKVLEFPGCIDVRTSLTLFKNLPQNIISYVEWSWEQAPRGSGFNNLGCKNQDPNGCGGAGNKCFYCDACNDLRTYNNQNRNAKLPRFDCPEAAGTYVYRNRRPICLDDWGDLDKNKDGEPDFITDPTYADYRKFLDSLGVDGFGTVKMNLFLLSNATIEQNIRLQREYKKIELAYETKPLNEIKQEISLLRLGQVRAGKERETMIEYRKNVQHRLFLQEYKARNVLACQEVLFDVCDSKPSPSRIQTGDSICT